MTLRPFLPALLFVLLSFSQLCLAQPQHPRIYIKDSAREAFLVSQKNTAWKKTYVEELKAQVDHYVALCEKDPEWMVSRLQMNWKTRHDKVFLKGGNFSHSEGKAPVPTVRFSGTRDWATNYLEPAIADVEPYFDDPRGMHLVHKESGKKEWIHPSKSGHIIEGINRKIMKLVQDAAFLYWLTGEERYARFAEPVFTQYIEGMYHREAPYDIDQTGQQRLSGLATFEVIHEKITIYLTVAYDFLYDYLRKHRSDQSHTIEVFQRWADQIIVNGVGENNWNFFQAHFLIYLAAALENNASYANGKGQEYYLDQIFEVTTDRQVALKESVLVFDQETGIWPESASYSLHVITSLLEVLTLYDQATETDAFADYPIAEKATLASFQYLFPSGHIIGFGDSKHEPISPDIFEMLIAHYDKYQEREKEQLISAMLQELIDRGEYTRKAGDLFHLFFYVDELDSDAETDIDPVAMGLMTPTFHAPSVSMFLQRLGAGRHAIMASTVGAYGNHAHANGIGLELFANNYVLGPDMGRGPSYWHPDHRDYYSQFAAHNTVAVNGQSTYRTMLSYHPYTLDNSFPVSGQPASQFDKVTFSKASFVEPATNAQQQRLTAIVQTESEQAYVLDIFRSAVAGSAAQRHDYFYHNLGQTLEIRDSEDHPLALQSTDKLSSAAGDHKAYDYFQDKQGTATDKDLSAVFRLSTSDQPDNLMKLWVKGSADQSVFSVQAPPSRAISKRTAPDSMLGAQLPTLVLRREQAAWEDPFAVIYNPYLADDANAVSAVDFSTALQPAGAQAIVVSLAEQGVEDHIVANASVNELAGGDDFYQKGLLSIVRRRLDDRQPVFFFVSGVYRFDYEQWQVISVGTAVTVSIEVKGEDLYLQNDQPVLIRIPKGETDEMPTILLYENGELSAERKGVISRLNPEQVEFRLAKAYEKVVVKR
ncbi:hypothetical protein CRP01_17780 [Flavilitoribacter nigricans DSM 23189 = NBRC 102662]|uniref:Heparinase II/III-like protein n=2 Tax=Flavilitoribacter TaxID=2762562 RepID=A0A2D0NA17_FLAN2|nr:hypothetical protein CRP01_17780 [Flavilitoribacter nigricans DSM 23189 = NBRC 102662]